jgi:hypothetical protein
MGGEQSGNDAPSYADTVDDQDEGGGAGGGNVEGGTAERAQL